MDNKRAFNDCVKRGEHQSNLGRVCPVVRSYVSANQLYANIDGKGPVHKKY